jgi:Tfp pilus assembly protein PilX
MRTSVSRAQSGMTLFVAMIILVMITLLVTSAFKTSNTNLKVVSGMQGRQEAISASQAAIEDTISSAFFTSNPTLVAATPVGVDINNDGTDDYSVTMGLPKCLRTAPVVVSSPPTKMQLDCAGSSRLPGTITPTWCSNTVWELSATTTDKLTAASTTVRQGVGMTVEITSAKTTCK